MTKAKCFYGAVEIFFRELGRSTHYFQGSREHRPPPGGFDCLKELSLTFKLSLIEQITGEIG